MLERQYMTIGKTMGVCGIYNDLGFDLALHADGASGSSGSSSSSSGSSNGAGTSGASSAGTASNASTTSTTQSAAPATATTSATPNATVAAATADGSTAEKPAEGKTPEQLQAEYLSHIKGEYKDAHAAYIKGIIGEQTKKAAPYRERAALADKLADALSVRYGVSADDAEGLMAALQKDTSYLEQRAYEMGMTPEALSQMQQVQLRATQAERVLAQQQREAQVNTRSAELEAQHAQIMSVYPDFDITAEMNNPQTGEAFVRMVKDAGIPILQAYQAVHMDEVLQRSAQRAASEAREATLQEIQAQRASHSVEPGRTAGAPQAAGKRQFKTAQEAYAALAAFQASGDLSHLR